jgi:hypothetical protein
MPGSQWKADPTLPGPHDIACYLALKQGDLGGYLAAVQAAVDMVVGDQHPVSGFIGLKQLPSRLTGDMVQKVQARWPDAIRRNSAAIEGPPPETLKRPLVKDDGTDILISPPGSSGTTVIVFTGFADQAFAPIEVFDAFLAQQDAAAIFLRDSARNFFMPTDYIGVSDSNPFALRLRSELERLGTRNLAVCGTSAGGAAAVFYGLMLGATRMVTFSGPTTGRPEDRALLGDTRAEILMKQIFARTPIEQLDLRPWLLKAAAGKFGVPLDLRMYFGADNAIDRGHAERVADIPGVTVHPVAGFARHNVLQSAAVSGNLGVILAG